MGKPWRQIRIPSRTPLHLGKVVEEGEGRWRRKVVVEEEERKVIVTEEEGERRWRKGGE